MNNWHDEYMAEYRRQELINVGKQIQLENLIINSRVYHPSLFTQAMHSFASWMISTGKELHERYEIPTAHCHRTQPNSFAR